MGFTFIAGMGFHRDRGLSSRWLAWAGPDLQCFNFGGQLLDALLQIDCFSLSLDDGEVV